MTLLTDALRRIEETGDARVYAVDPFSKEERELAERIITATATHGPAPVVEGSAVALADPAEDIPAEPILGTEKQQTFHAESAHDRIRLAIAEAFHVPASGAHAQRPVAVNPRRRETESATAPCVSESEPSLPRVAENGPPVIRRDCGVSRQILEQLGPSPHGRVVALVQIQSSENLRQAMLQELLDATAEGLGGEDCSGVLVINAVNDPPHGEDETSGRRHERGEADLGHLVHAVKRSVRRPALLKDLSARHDAIELERWRERLPIWQSKCTVAETINFLEDCRAAHQWTLITVSHHHCHDLETFLSRCDGVLVVVESNEPKQRATHDTVGRLRKEGVKLIGAVVLETPGGPRRTA